MKAKNLITLSLLVLALFSLNASLGKAARAQGKIVAVAHPSAVPTFSPIVIRVAVKNEGDGLGWFLICLMKVGTEPPTVAPTHIREMASNCGSHMSLVEQLAFEITWISPGEVVELTFDKFWMPPFVDAVKFEVVLIVWQHSLQVNDDGSIENMGIHDSKEFKVKAA